MRILWFSILIISMVLNKEELMVINEKSITVKGNTSLGNFECTYNVENLGDTLSFINNITKDQFRFDIPVGEFTCGNFLLNHDFRKTLKSKEYPKAYVKVTNLKKNRKNYTCDLYLDIVGKNLIYPDFKLRDNGTSLNGDLILDFDHLELEPPSKLGGLIKVDELLNLSLSLSYR